MQMCSRSYSIFKLGSTLRKGASFGQVKNCLHLSNFCKSAKAKVALVIHVEKLCLLFHMLFSKFHRSLYDFCIPYRNSSNVDECYGVR